jgi:2-polyprenyl-3-methyl-5-hydroxy-6-metoxy-1,4-benzoquinol methylase
MVEINRSKQGRWVKDTIGVLYVVDDIVQFADDYDHLANGFCRLLEVSEEKVAELIEEWVEQSYITHDQLLPSQISTEGRIQCLRQAVLKVFGLAGQGLVELSDARIWGTDFLGNQADTIYAGSISGNLSRAVVGNKTTGFAWLVNPQEHNAVDARSIEYDTAYFDDKADSHYGMKQYLKHTEWRMQKARRCANHMLDVAGVRAVNWLKEPAKVSLLDVGSAIGLFRAAVGELGLTHYGIDVSTDAIDHCLQGFGFSTWLGSIFDVGKHAQSGQKFNIITFWDVIEHLDHHVEALQYITQYLTDDGIVVVRTPNLESMEATILGDMYYSYKLDHTSYFSVRSLNSMFKLVGMEPIHTETISHIFKGCLGVQYLYEAGKRMEGADILAVYGRTGKVSQ